MARTPDTYRPTGECENCGTTDNLVWDHIDPSTKDFNVGSGFYKGFSHARIMAEIEKCRILCGPCNSTRANVIYGDDIIQLARESSLGCREFARRYGISHQHVSRIRRGLYRNRLLRVAQ